MNLKRDIRAKLGWAAALVLAAGAAWAVRDYKRWRALGPGGLPANVRGWLSMTRYRLQARDELETASMLRTSPLALETYESVQAWQNPRPRPGTRPKVSPYPIPHRQLDQLPGQPTRAALKLLFDRKVDEHAEAVEYALSHFERRHLAITLKAPASRVAGLAFGEIAHIHPSDNSMHMVLSPRDAVAAVESGWGQRHGLAGLAVDLPETYLMVYAPRQEADLEMVEGLTAARLSSCLAAGVTRVRMVV